MINTSVSKNEETIQSGVVDYPIGFKFYFNPDRTPQLRVKIGDEELRFKYNFDLSEDKGSVVLMPTEEESWTLEDPEDFSWMTKWDGKDLLIERAVPLVQDSDYQLGRISSEQIERDFDLSVMRDQQAKDVLDNHGVRIAKAEEDISSIKNIHEEHTELIQALEDGKLDIDQGKNNIGKVMAVNEYGNIVPKATVTGEGLGVVAHDSTLTGDGTDEHPLGVKNKVRIIMRVWNDDVS